ncbi:MAG: thioredoxin family protein [Candidatus Heimdallarchaeota archaeon]
MSRIVIQITDDALKYTKEIFQKMENEVELIVFTTQNHCLFCNELSELIAKVAELSPKIKTTPYVRETDTAEAKKYSIDKHPAIVVRGKKDFNVRFFGLPGGLEYGSFIETIVEASTGKPELQEATIEKISLISEPVHIQVFVTPMCPYCPMQVRLVHKLAMINSNITGDMIEAMEFQELAAEYDVLGVPKTVINEELHLEGAYPEPMFVQKILEFLEKKD